MSENIQHVDLYDFNYSWLEKLPHSPKVLLLGSSTIKYGLNAKIIAEDLGYEEGQVINLAENGRTPIQTYQLLHDLPQAFFDSVSYVVLGVDSWTYSQKYYEHNTVLMYDLTPVQSVYLRYSSEKQITFNEIISIPLYRRLLGDKEIFDKELDVPEFYGSGRLEKKPKNFDESVNNWFSPNIFSFSDIQFKHLKEILNFLEKKGIKVILVNTPKRSNWRNDFHSNCEEVQNDFIDHLNEVIGSTRYLIHTEMVSKDSESLFFNDGIHFNTIGQDWYSHEFAKGMRETP